MSNVINNANAVTRRNLLGFASLGALMVPVAGCVTVLPKSDPIQLYSFRFRPELVATKSEEFAGTPTDIFLSKLVFSTESGSDRLISREDNQLAYIGGARWSVPAVELFTQAVLDGFRALGKKVRLDNRPGGHNELRLDLTVSRFEVDYVKHKPMIEMALEAKLVRLKDRTTLAILPLMYEVAVEKNKTSAIVAAFEVGATDLITQLVDFCETQT